MLEIRTGNSNFKLNISKDLSEKLFLKLVNTTTNMLENEPSNSDLTDLKVLKPKEEKTNVLENEVACTQEVSLEDTIKEMDEIAKSLDTQSDFITHNQVIDSKLKDSKVVEKPFRLIVTICPDCGRKHIKYINGNTIYCTCGNSIEFDDSELVDGAYTCPDCEAKGYFKVLGQLDSIACVKCKKEILLDYDTTTGRYGQVF